MDFDGDACRMGSMICMIHVTGYMWMEKIEKDDPNFVIFSRKYTSVILNNQSVFLVPYSMFVPIVSYTDFGFLNREIIIGDCTFPIEFLTSIKVVKTGCWSRVPKYIHQFVDEAERHKGIQKTYVTDVQGWVKEFLQGYLQKKKNDEKKIIT